MKEKNILLELREKNIVLSKNKIRESITEDNYIMQAINNIEELAKITNSLSKRLRDWYAIYLPEFSKKVSDNESFVKLVAKKNKQELMNEMQLTTSMGKDLEEKDLEPILSLAKSTSTMFELREQITTYLESVMENYCKNILTIAGAIIAAKLLEEAGSLRKLAMIPSSTMQLLGAEKALFRHLKSGSKPPKHGYIIMHPLVSKAKKSDRGKVARVLADKLSIAARADFFKGEFIGDKLKRELEAKFI